MGGDSFSPSPNGKHPYDESTESTASSDDEFSCLTLLSEAAERHKLKVYSDVMNNYEEFQSRSDRLDEAKEKILSYKPGALAHNEDRFDLHGGGIDLPGVTTLLVIGPKGSGKSSLVNKISRVLETGVSGSSRAPVSCNNKSPSENGTYFLSEYVIPRGSGSFCFYDTRGLSDELSENEKTLERWMTKGVRHGELIERKSDSAELRARLKLKSKRATPPSESRAVDFVIFVVNAISVLESMNKSEEGNETDHLKTIVSCFNDAVLSFRDEKPAIVVTHGDLLPLRARTRIRIFLGDLLGIPPTYQIFDIPESNDPATTIAIFDMLVYVLSRADERHLCSDLHPRFEDSTALRPFQAISLKVMLFSVLLLLVAAFVSMFNHDEPELSPLGIEWHKIRHLWFD